MQIDQKIGEKRKIHFVLTYRTPSEKLQRSLLHIRV